MITSYSYKCEEGDTSLLGITTLYIYLFVFFCLSVCWSFSFVPHKTIGFENADTFTVSGFSYRQIYCI